MSKDEHTALHVACAGGHCDIVRKLLESGASADGIPIADSKEPTENSNSETGVIGSRSGTLSESAESSENAVRCTRPIHLAAKNGSSKIIKLLADAGANVDAQNERKQSPLHIATSNSNLSVRFYNFKIPVGHFRKERRRFFLAIFPVYIYV